MKTDDPTLELFLNYACQAKCGFCYNPPIDDQLLRLELSFEQAAAALYQASHGGTRRLNLHGGEVTLRDDLPKIVRLARKLGFIDITLVTNGVRLGDGRYARSLASAGLTSARLSIHAPNAPAHDAIVQVPGAFVRARRAMAHMEKLGVAVGINFVLIAENASLLPEFLKMLVVDAGVKDVIVYFPHERGMMALNAARLSMSYQDTHAHLLDAAAMLTAAGRRDALKIANVPPCAAPELLDVLLDWERSHEGSPAAMLHPEGHESDLSAMKDGQRRPIAACRSCTLSARCRGVESEYLRRHGDAALRPLDAVPFLPPVGARR